MEKDKRLKHIWYAIRQRCENPKAQYYKNYGGRGISICQEWEDFKNFKEWALEAGYDENAPKGECTIDRIDVDGNYCPENCRWITAQEQNLNKTNTIMATYHGETKPVLVWAEELGIPYPTLIDRIKQQDLTEEEIFSTQKYRNYKKYTFRGETHTLHEWADILGINYGTLRSRVKRKNFNVEKDFVVKDFRINHQWKND